ncbi:MULTISPECIES: HAMP domain-containing sensor histidine kinase [Caballeronia]|uniref:histidine kinase n=1 Tax=Caballeronia zhejiangensis TaxID=871203 RepID=A0A656QIV2_9BURK|nr:MULTISPECIES: HAMP domain-containing sensor histidine kinase [Caballeronia]EKS66581.1 two-component regulatory system, sensor kinase protein [Burkholderia sp. SJ98]KDR30845.1 histidine kinase [Caballeronia zhejiangensis]MDR5790143.1 HAMP domain-containing sensor histidine kinase [Caballeronia sp. LP003]
MKLTLSQRLFAVFCVLLLACCGASAWLQIRASDLREKEVIQSLSRGLAAHIARDGALADANDIDAPAVRRLFSQLMVVNPSVEVYLLDNTGRVRADDAPPGHLKRDHVDLAPVRQFLDGAVLPILGDDPRSEGKRKVFSAAPLAAPGKPPFGYVYVVLLGEEHDALAAKASASAVLRTTLASMGLVTLLGLVAGLVAFGLVTRPLRRLTEAMRKFDARGAPAEPPALARIDTPDARANERDEIVVLESAFAQMAERIGEQWRALGQQDRERREMVANISHDLRTPLSSLHGYLETLSLKSDTLPDTDRRRYLSIALAQSAKVGHLAQSLFELAKLEHGMVAPEAEAFSLADLVQDVFEKFELPAQSRGVRLNAQIAPRLPNVTADLGMIERVFTNLLDNAIRHTPAQGVVDVTLALAREQSDRVEVTISDTGTGIPPEMRKALFMRPFASGGAHRGGLGLLIVQRMLQLHGSQIRLIDSKDTGTTFHFDLPVAFTQTGNGAPQVRGGRG